MKKLLIALAAGAAAIGTYAATAINGAGFDSADTSANYSWAQDGGFKTTVWSGITDGVMTLQEGDCGRTENRPAGYQSDPDVGVGGDGYMNLKTTLGNPVLQRATAESTTFLPDAGFYYDGLVKFTAFDEMPDMSTYAGAKIAIFPMLESDEDGADANLYVYAQGGSNYWKTAVTVDDAWHRVTIKMIKNVTRTADATKVGYVVFIDGTAVDCIDAKVTGVDLNPAAKAWNDEGKLFLSMADTAEEFTGVAYDGQGALDEVGFTDEAPSFAQDAEYYTVTFDPTQIARLYVKVGDDAAQEFTTSPADIQQAENIKYWYDAQSGYVSLKEANAKDLTDSITIDDVAEIAAKFGDAEFDTIAAAVNAANIATASGTLKLFKGADAIQISNPNAVTVTIDLNGQTVTNNVRSVMPISTVVVTDTSDNKNGKVDGAVGGPKFSIDAGWYKADPSAYLAKGFIAPKDQTDNYYKVEAATGLAIIVAENGTIQQFDSLEEAAAAAVNGVTVKMLDDYAPTGVVKFVGTDAENVKVTFHNDYVVKTTLEGTYSFVVQGMTLTMEGDGSYIKEGGTVSAILVGVTENEASNCGVASGTGNLIVEGGKIECGTAEKLATNDTQIASNAIKVADGDCTFNAGEVTNYRYDQGRCVRASGANSKVTVNGGSFASKGAATVAPCVAIDAENGGIVAITCPSVNDAKFWDDMTRYCASGYATKRNTEEPDDPWYYVVEASGTKYTLTVDRNPAAEKLCTFTKVMINQMPAEAADTYQLEEGRTYAVTYTAVEGYAFAEKEDKDKGVWTYTLTQDVKGTIGTEDVTVVVPTPTKKVRYAITVTGGTADKAVYQIDAAAAQTVTLTPGTPEEGKEFDAWTLTEKTGVSIEGNVITIAANTIGEIAVAATWKDAQQAIDPADPESKQTVEAESPADAVAKAQVAIPAEAQSAEVTADEYKAYFNLTATQAGVNKYDVQIIGLKPEVVEAPTTADLVANFDEIGEDGLTVTAKPGLFYGVKQAAAVDGVAAAKVDSAGLATGNTVKLPVAKQGNAGFYKVVVDVKPFAAAE